VSERSERTVSGVTEAVEAPEQRSYWQVLRDRKLATLLAGDAISKTGDGMSFVGLPLLALQLHGSVPAALAVALVNGAPLLAPFGVSLYFGLGKRRFDPRLVLLIDSTVRGTMFVVLGALGLAGRLDLALLLGVLMAGSVLRLLSSSARRLAAVEMVDEDGRLAVNGLLGTSDNLSLFVAGPALGGLVVALHSPEMVLLLRGLVGLDDHAADAGGRAVGAGGVPVRHVLRAGRGGPAAARDGRVGR
jgi:hypothetical protein